MADTDTITLYFKAPVSELEAHSHIFADSTGKAKFELYKNPVVTDPGTPATVANRNLQFPVVPEMTIYHTPTVSDMGELFYLDFLGSDKRVGGGTRSAEEFVFADGVEILVVVTSQATTIDARAGIDWYEHPYLGI